MRNWRKSKLWATLTLLCNKRSNWALLSSYFNVSAKFFLENFQASRWILQANEIKKIRFIATIMNLSFPYHIHFIATIVQFSTVALKFSSCYEKWTGKKRNEKVFSCKARVAMCGGISVQTSRVEFAPFFFLDNLFFCRVKEALEMLSLIKSFFATKNGFANSETTKFREFQYSRIILSSNIWFLDKDEYSWNHKNIRDRRIRSLLNSTRNIARNFLSLSVSWRWKSLII